MEYEVGDLFLRYDHEFEVIAKLPYCDYDGERKGSVYLVRSRMFGSLHNTFTTAYDGDFDTGYERTDNYLKYTDIRNKI